MGKEENEKILLTKCVSSSVHTKCQFLTILEKKPFENTVEKGNQHFPSLLSMFLPNWV